MMSFDKMVVPDIIRILGKRFKDYRVRLRLTQKEVSDMSTISVMTISKFESGVSTNISLGTYILLLQTLGLSDRLDDVLPELPENPYAKQKVVKPKDMQ